MDLTFMPIIELVLWGFISIYLGSLDIAGINLATILLGGIIFWDLLSQAQRAVSLAFLEDVWERNLLNIFVTPLRISEFLTSLMLVGLVRVVLVAIIMGALAFAMYNFNLLMLGLSLIPFVANLLIFGWSLGIFTTAIVMRYGTSAQILSFVFILLVQPFSAVFYPVSALPSAVQFISYLLPPTYVFEGMRAVIAGAGFPVEELVYGFLTNLIYLGLTCWFFSYIFARVKERGLLLKID